MLADFGHSGTIRPVATEQNQLNELDNLELTASPNPFNPSTVIRYSLPVDARVQLTVYDLIGRRVADLVNTRQRAGEHSVNFDGSRLASGMYLYRLQVGNTVVTRKLTLLK